MLLVYQPEKKLSSRGRHEKAEYPGNSEYSAELHYFVKFLPLLPAARRFLHR